MKTYKVKSSAARTAKKEFGADYKEKGSIVQDAEGMWYFELNEDRLIEPTAEEVEETLRDIPLVAPDPEKEPPAKLALSEPLETDGPVVVAKVVDSEELEEGVEITSDDVIAKVKPKSSLRDNPCKAVWEIADNMKGEKRKDIIAACVSAGIAYNTARTQYQRYYTASKK